MSGEVPLPSDPVVSEPPPPGPAVPRFSAASLPDADANWGEFERQGSTRALRVTGPFEVEMQDGTAVRIEDGWLAIDAVGQPYPITQEVFEASYARPLTFVKKVLALQAELEQRRDASVEPAVKRDLALAITACEDMRSRYTQARARQQGVFSPADVDEITAPAERALFEQALTDGTTPSGE